MNLYASISQLLCLSYIGNEAADRRNIESAIESLRARLAEAQAGLAAVKGRQQQPTMRLTAEQIQRAINEAVHINASPHEWPKEDQIPLLCNAILDQDNTIERLADENRKLRIQLTQALAERDSWKKNALEWHDPAVAALIGERDLYQAGEARAVEALRKIGEELKSVASDKEEEVRDDFTSGQSHGWAMAYLHVVQILGNKDNSQPALDWLAQQRREAAAEALEEFAYDADGIEELITCNIFDLRSALRTRAAALLAGEVGDE